MSVYFDKMIPSYALKGKISGGIDTIFLCNAFENFEEDFAFKFWQIILLMERTRFKRYSLSKKSLKQ